MICSDGLHGYVKEEEIFRIINKEKDVRHIVHELINASKSAGGYDNVSVIILVHEEGDSHE